jgi:ABC-type multidrug transport system ATPase subunit
MCFGLLGVNGAGKTSTLGMITGEFPPSAGEAWLAQRSIMGQANEVKRLIGYCPQFDPLFPLLTGREHLEFYARLKGVE